jgi:hypothetical protein
VAEELDVLKRAGYAEASDLVGSFAGELVRSSITIGELNRALLRSAKPADAVEEACFSGAVRSNDGEDLASPHLEVYFREGGYAAEAKSEVGDTESNGFRPLLHAESLTDRPWFVKGWENGLVELELARFPISLIVPVASFVHSECATLDVGAVQTLDGRLCFTGISHLHETKSTRLVRVSVHDDACSVYSAEPFERLL